MTGMRSLMKLFCRSRGKTRLIGLERISKIKLLKIKLSKILMICPSKTPNQLVSQINWRLIGLKSIFKNWLRPLTQQNVILRMTGQNGSKKLHFSFWSKIHRLCSSHVLLWQKCMRLWLQNFTTSRLLLVGEICKMLISHWLWKLSLMLTNRAPEQPRYCKLFWI